jgi:hypothetical protein
MVTQRELNGLAGFAYASGLALCFSSGQSALAFVGVLMLIAPCVYLIWRLAK